MYHFDYAICLEYIENSHFLSSRQVSIHNDIYSVESKKYHLKDSIK